jgi:quercetin dioxygenase-like cupin family protein
MKTSSALLLLPVVLLSSLSGFASPAEEGPASAPPIQVETLLKTTESWDGNTLPPYSEGQPEVTILRITIAPGTALPEHKHPYMNAGVLLRGRLIVKLDSGETHQLEAGDSIAEVVETWHYGSNNGTEPAEILVVYAGIEGELVTVLRHASEPKP